MKAAGFDVLTANDGVTGPAAALREKADLIVLDLMLAEMGGLDICRNLRVAVTCSSLPAPRVG
jgi:DNA-binding response OmpR family regulator